MKSIAILIITFLSSICFATESEEQISPILAEPIEIVLVCPEGSAHEGEELPQWVTTEEAAEFFCNEATEDTEIAE